MQGRWIARTIVAVALVLGWAGLAGIEAPEGRAADPCAAPITNPVACENTKPGNPKSEWDVSGAGSSTIQGFATDISVNLGETVHFKVKTTAKSYRLDIYRMGYYGGDGARKIASVNPAAALPQTQPACLTNTGTGLIDCGNWAESASWAVPATAVSGIYFARLVRTDGTAGASHVMFIVRDDSSHSDLLFQTSDTTWQAYNSYGGNSLYTGNPAGRAYKVSYNRPFNTRAGSPEDWVFNAEYPMVRFLEANGYDVSYSTGVDTDRRGALIKNHKLFMSVGHDEYWSGGQRANVEAARDAGVNLAFFSGNEMFWKTRWESSIDSSAKSYRTLVCYKETHANAKIDPSPQWTGTWMDPRFSPPADGGRPQNALTGQLFEVNDGTVSVQVSAAEGKYRLWRSTRAASLPAGGSTTIGSGTVGYEWDVDADNGFRPKGLIDLSTTNATGLQVLQDYGSTYGAGGATHHLVLYRADSGALVFGAGSAQWSWALDSNHDRGSAAADAAGQQATVNLFADMGGQPATLQSGLTAATASTDTTPPTSTITSPTGGGSVPPSSSITISGTASDTGGVVAGVEISTDGGTTWHPASGTTSWSYHWRTPSSGSVTIKTRATDDSGRTETPSAGVQVTVGGPPAPVSCPCSLWTSTDKPTTTADPDGSATEVGVKFRPDRDGTVSGIRFYKGTGNTGTHVGHLWSSTGTQLASATFNNESASGWQQANFSSPVSVKANTTYVASYYAPSGHYAEDDGYFATSGYGAAPLYALAAGEDGPNGVYRSGTGFPSSNYQSANYWVDVVFSPSVSGPDTTPPRITSRTPSSGATGVSVTTSVSASFSEPIQSGTAAVAVSGPGGTVAGTTTYDGSTSTVTFKPSAALAANTTYNVSVSGAKDIAGNTMTADSWAFTTAAAASGTYSIWAGSAVPTNASEPDSSPVELGMRFRSDVAGTVTGVRFYKGSGNTGTHVGHLWSNTGQLLGTLTFGAESATGWQSASFGSPITITPGTTYVVSYYAPSGHYADDDGFFASSGVDNGPLHALKDGIDGANGVYRYATGGGFPASTWQSANYWVDVVFTPGS